MRTLLAMISASSLGVMVIMAGSVAVKAQGPVVRPIRRVTLQPAGDKVMRVHTVSSAAQPQNDKLEMEPPPEKLTPAQKFSLTGVGLPELSVAASFTLTAAHPFLSNRGTLSFLRPTIVSANPAHPFAAFPTQTDYPGGTYGFLNDRDVTVMLGDMTVGKHYMIDCAVKGADTYYVKVTPGGLEQSFSSTNHIIVVLEAGDVYAEVSIAGKATNHNWYFYSAEITRLD
jgi:hypothetical protein